MMADRDTPTQKNALSEHLQRIIGMNLRIRRKELGYTQAQVAALMGETYSHVTISNHERGGDHMNVLTLVMYSRVLQISVHDLLADPVLKGKIAVTPEYYELSEGDCAQADEYIILLWSASRVYR